ncbi:sam and ph domain containing protein [Niveomyces insectorum RCEF 264]|uniref:Sam and ph domain containing protein n=1 Tax=Niveomyces insectorum RCEF 264 TaxID=1081102 RepID=A0A168AE32_9HYPO|nr:sam and ph domain containing protein [Niveomyces insectorum RCEF 264]
MLAASRRPAREMQQRNTMLLHDSLFSLKGVQDRPVSVTTEFMVSDYDDDDILSDFDDVENSPRASLNSSGQPSFTTISSYDEVHTPRSSQMPMDLAAPADPKAVEGPRGPHLFRISTLSAEFENALSLSPLTPKVTTVASTGHDVPLPLGITPLPARKPHSGPFRFSNKELDTNHLATWYPEQVAQWMLNAGIELQVCERFVENDITGGILITLKFEDLKELGIPSFGVRTTVWNQISAMKNIPLSTEPRPDTPIEDEPDREVRRELHRQDSCAKPLRRRASSRRKKPRADDVITPLESVSIVGIEQMMPKPHQCSKGENCAKWKRNQRMMEAFKKDHPFVDMDKGGRIMIAGDPGNPETARAILPSEDVFRPVSDAIPSVVASSDVMGPGPLATLQALEEDSLRTIQSRDPQDNVRQFLNFQHQHVLTSSEVPPTPPFELFPTRQQPHEGLRALPKLSIPAQSRHSSALAAPAFGTNGITREPMSAHPVSAHPSLGSAQAYPASAKTASAAPTSGSSYTYTAIEESPDRTPTAVYRFGTPFSEMDVPVTAVPAGPIAREVSQSVPPDMNYRAPPTRTVSRASARRPSFPVLPSLDENKATLPPRKISPVVQQPPRAASAMGHRNNNGFGSTAVARPLQPPPRVKYPWSPDRSSFETAIAPMALLNQSASSSSSSLMSGATAGTGGASSAMTGLTSVSSGGVKDAEGVSYQGPVKKRKTKMLRHEWHDRYVTLKGTRMAMHKDAETVDRTLEYIDIDDYAIACSSMVASSSKLNAAFKAMNIRRGSEGGNKNDVAAFAFQLIPQDGKGGVRLKKRDSTMPASGQLASASASSIASGSTGPVSAVVLPPPPPPPADAANGTGKTHHFAVKSRDERIEWMRELMLAKAMRQKGEGFEISVNGNMI